jgi:hypothetical protein
VNLPEVETLVYLGLTRFDYGAGQLKTHFVFQSARSYQGDGDWTELPEVQREELANDARVMLYDEGSVQGIADIDGLLVLITILRDRMLRGLGWDIRPKGAAFIITPGSSTLNSATLSASATAIITPGVFPCSISTASPAITSVPSR